MLVLPHVLPGKLFRLLFPIILSPAWHFVFVMPAYSFCLLGLRIVWPPLYFAFCSSDFLLELVFRPCLFVTLRVVEPGWALFGRRCNMPMSASVCRGFGERARSG